MVDQTWDRLVIIGKLAAFSLPLMGAVTVVYSSLEVVKTDLRHTSEENTRLRADLANWRVELRGEIADLRDEVRDIRNGRAHP